MPITTRQALDLLDVYVEQARDNDDKTKIKRYGSSSLEILVDESGPRFFWGPGEVDRRIAACVVMTFTDASRC